jgi:hypothetical protein
MRARNRKTYLFRTLFAVAILFPVIQLVPYGRDHKNPPLVREPDWNSRQTRELAIRACFDCHSNSTVWPWYADLAPLSWLVQRDVQEGRSHLNFSDWGQGRREGEEAGKIRKAIEEGDMPPLQYLLMHPEARLTDLQKRELVDGLMATVGNSGGPSAH